MVTSTEGRQGEETGEQIAPADPSATPEADGARGAAEHGLEPEAAAASEAPDEPATLLADAAVEEPPGEPWSWRDEQAERPAFEQAPLAEAFVEQAQSLEFTAEPTPEAAAPEPTPVPPPFPPSPEALTHADPGAEDTPFSEDEATGRRVESLLAEAPDADPEGPLPERGEPVADLPAAFELSGFESPLFEEEPAQPDPAVEVFEPQPELDFTAAAGRSGDDFFGVPKPAPLRTPPPRRNGMDRVGPIVAFDFDGTLTVRDSFTAFLKWREGAARYHAEMAALAPAALRYLFDRDPGKLKAAAVKRFLAGLPRSVLNAEAMEFATSAAPLLFRPDALRAWRRYRQDGARLMIVTASPENIVAPFARGLGADLLIGTQLIFDQEDRVQGGLLGDNCRGPVKPKRIREALGEDVVLAAAYGDTDGDWEMLEMAEQQFMRLFVGVPGKPTGPG